MGKILKFKFFNRDTKKVAEEMLGCFLVRKIGKRIVRLPITETEAYDGFKDLASHASRGKTPRNQIMFGGPGHFYIYFTYGMHWMLNVVTREKGYPAAVLIRGAGEFNGPAKLTKALRIDKKLNGAPASLARGLPRVPSRGLWLEKGIVVSKNRIKKMPRVGVAYAGPIWSRKKYRFVLAK